MEGAQLGSDQTRFQAHSPFSPLSKKERERRENLGSTLCSDLCAPHKGIHGRGQTQLNKY